MSAANETDIKEIEKVVSNLRTNFDTGRTKPLAWRVQQLKALRTLLSENEKRLSDALTKDLHRPYFEAFGMPISTRICNWSSS